MLFVNTVDVGWKIVCLVSTEPGVRPQQLHPTTAGNKRNCDLIVLCVEL